MVIAVHPAHAIYMFEIRELISVEMFAHNLRLWEWGNT